MTPAHHLITVAVFFFYSLVQIWTNNNLKARCKEEQERGNNKLQTNWGEKKEKESPGEANWVRSIHMPSILYSCTVRMGTGIAQLVEFLTEKPDAILTWVWVLSVARDLSPSADSPAMSIEPPCAIACIDICAHVNNPRHWQPYPSLDTRKHCAHW